MKKQKDRERSALDDQGMSSPIEIRNTTAPRKVRDMSEDGGHEDRDPEKDYRGAAKKDH